VIKKRADNIRPYGNHDDTHSFNVGRGLAPAVNKSLPCAKGGVTEGDGGIVIPSRQKRNAEGSVPCGGAVVSKNAKSGNTLPSFASGKIC